MSNEYVNSAASSLPEGVRLFQEGNFQEALPILEAHAHEDALVAMLTAQAAKKLGDAAGCKRYLFMAADDFGSGDAALMLAQEYAQEDNFTPALTWAERANKARAPGAGQLILRLSEKTGQWEKCLKLALESLEWLQGYDRFSLCEEIGTLLDGNHYSDEVILALVGPVLSGLDNDPVAKECLEAAYRNAETRKINAEEQERKAREQKELERQAQQNKQEAKAQAEERAKQAIKMAEKAKKGQTRNKKMKNVLRRLLAIILAIVLPLPANILANKIVMTFFYSGTADVQYYIASFLGGLLICGFCWYIVTHVMPEGSEDFLSKGTVIVCLLLSPFIVLGVRYLLSLGAEHNIPFAGLVAKHAFTLYNSPSDFGMWGLVSCTAVGLMALVASL